ncbi:MAG TPA: flagellar basal body rod protein FlgC [Gammaproteobacteria bacterium]|nr:flagellar basal body rod protein FlgC [Gammaproteobacteria bacterium]
MSLFNIFDIAGSSLSAQSLRLNTTASNMANADTVSSTPQQAYRARQPVFAAVMNALGGDQQEADVAVKVLGIVESRAPVRSQYEPNNPLADARGYVYTSNVNPIEEMANMISASRSYQSNLEVINTSKQLMLRTLAMGQ